MICQMKTESKWSLYRHITPSGKVYIGRKKSIEEKEKISKAFSKPVALLDSNGYVIKRYNSATEAAIELDIDISYLNKCCRLLKVCKGYRFVRI